jgi:tetratricopeptide (TPR) repeat protein
MVEVFPAGGKAWVPAKAGQILQALARLRTGPESRVALLWSDQSVIPLGASTEIEILPPNLSKKRCGLFLISGIISFFHRDKPGQIEIITHGAIAGVEGTEFVLAVNDTNVTTLSVIDGKVSFGNAQSTLLLTNGEQAIVEPGQPPARTPGFIANNLLQWCFYYPAILDLNDLPLTIDEKGLLVQSLATYRAGDLLDALTKFSAGPKLNSDGARIYHAALLLSVGDIDKAQSELSSIANSDQQNQRLADALHVLIAAVKRQPDPSTLEPKLATEFLADSYYEQSRAVPEVSLERALDLAKRAAAISPQSGFAWERVAELEFSFGRTGKSLDALNKSLTLSPRNPEALALKGFLLAGQSRTREAIPWFNRSLAIDSEFGNAWLGRGLCRIRLGDLAGGREDLLVAAALEPQRAVLRSYLGKAYDETWDYRRARQELQRAEKLDPNDPTAWLYSALLDQEHNQINSAICDLEKSEKLNDNRSVYRSQLLLDQDQAVRSASLATMYRDDGMFDVSVNEASRAVNYDYANYSAHMFLADSYEQLSDPGGINVRYETPAESEYLVANLLAPASVGTLSPTISEGEYSTLFSRDGLGVVSDSEYLSRGAWTQSGAQFGTFGNFSYDFEVYYHSDPGQWVNNDTEQRQLSLTVKQQLTPHDTVYLNVQQYQSNFGDLQQYYNPDMVNPNLRAAEMQNPNVGLGYNHEWRPGVYTLFFVTRLNDTTSFTNSAEPTLLAFYPDIGGEPTFTLLRSVVMAENYQNRLNIYSAELQQIWEQPSQTTIAGTRVQYGRFDTYNLQNSPSLPFPFANPAASQDINSLFDRISFYGYHQWQIFDPLQLIGGLDYDSISFPEDFLTAPVSGNEKAEQQFSPKAGLIWTPWESSAVRFAYTRSLSGASVDQSYQIEPSQVAGFIQNYRSVIPESISGGNAGARFSTYDLSLEEKFHTGTYLTLSGEILDSSVDRVDGLFTYSPPAPSGSALTSGGGEDLNYQEESLQFAVNQLLGKEWSLGLKYRVSQAVLNDSYAGVPDSDIDSSVDYEPRTKGILSQLDLTAIYNHPSGFFAECEALWFDQINEGYNPAEPGDDFWQFNFQAGYRTPRRNVEMTIGLLNVTGRSYNLNPLNIYNELPLTRTLAASLRFNF